MRKLFWTAALALVLSSAAAPALASPDGEAAPTLEELERQIFGPAEDGGNLAVPTQATAGPLLAARNDWWCCFVDSDCYPYGGTRCIGGQVCGVCVP